MTALNPWALPMPAANCSVCHRRIGYTGWTAYGRNATSSLKPYRGREATICWTCTRAELRATTELIRRHHDEYEFLVACWLARTTPYGEPIGQESRSR